MSLFSTENGISVLLDSKMEGEGETALRKILKE